MAADALGLTTTRWPGRWRVSHVAAASFAVLALVLAAVALPLATYTVSLACFGLAHVASEMRYVRLRFGDIVHRRLSIVLLVSLGAVVGLRIGRALGLIEGYTGGALELMLVVLMAAAVVPALWRQGRKPALWGLAVVLALAVGLALSAVHTLLILAVLHNITPLGFLADGLRGHQRRLVLAAACLVFVGLPLVIATGIPFHLVASTLGVAPEASPFPVGVLADHFGAYLPASLHQRSWAIHAFSAVVFAQCMHYAVVIGVMPRLLDDAQGERLKASGLFGASVLALGAVLVVGFMLDFGQARTIYGMAAAVHAWIEVPILMLALAALAGSKKGAIA